MVEEACEKKEEKALPFSHFELKQEVGLLGFPVGLAAQQHPSKTTENQLCYRPFTPTVPCSNYGSGLSGNCFAIDLTPSSTARWQIVGHPFPYSVSWADVRVATYNGSAWTQRTPSQAAADNIMAKEMWRWSGSTYETKDDATVGLTGTLQPQEAVWVRMLTGSSAFSSGNIKLLVPAR